VATTKDNIEAALPRTCAAIHVSNAMRVWQSSLRPHTGLTCRRVVWLLN